MINDYNNQKKDYFEEMRKFHEEKIAIRKGCPNSQCFCTGKCQEIIGWRDKTDLEKNPNWQNGNQGTY